MDFEFGNQYFIYFAILLCLNIILFYMFYRLYLKINYHSDRLDKLDKLLAEILVNVNGEQHDDATPKESITHKESTKTKKQKIAPEEKNEVLNFDNESLEVKEEIQND